MMHWAIFRYSYYFFSIYVITGFDDVEADFVRRHNQSDVIVLIQ